MKQAFHVWLCWRVLTCQTSVFEAFVHAASCFLCGLTCVSTVNLGVHVCVCAFVLFFLHVCNCRTSVQISEWFACVPDSAVMASWQPVWQAWCYHSELTFLLTCLLKTRDLGCNDLQSVFEITLPRAVCLHVQWISKPDMPIVSTVSIRSVQQQYVGL